MPQDEAVTLGSELVRIALGGGTAIGSQDGVGGQGGGADGVYQPLRGNRIQRQCGITASDPAITHWRGEPTAAGLPELRCGGGKGIRIEMTRP